MITHADEFTDPVALSFQRDARDAQEAHQWGDAARLLYAAAFVEWGVDDARVGEAYRQAVAAGGVEPDQEMIDLHGFDRTLCLTHHEQFCLACYDGWGRVTCHHPDHEDGCILDVH